MKLVAVLFSAIFLISNLNSFEIKSPTVLVSILVRNKAHTLPYFLTLFQRLNYPKDRIGLWIRSDHNVDNTIEILRKWIDSVKDQYNSINLEIVETPREYVDEKGPAHWTIERFEHVIQLRKSALNYARKLWADYYLSLDCDVFLTNPNTLQHLMSKNFTVVAPMLKSDSSYSNFWAAMSDDYYYKRIDEYRLILDRENTGCFTVPMIYSCVLIDLRHKQSDYLTYDPNEIENFDGPIDDMITFAIGANKSDVSLNLCNDEHFGYIMPPLESDDALTFDLQQLTNIKLEALTEDEPLRVNQLLEMYTSIPKEDTMDFDKIFMINLKRRPEKRIRMKRCFDELGLDVTIFDAVDGRFLNESVMEKISFLPGYEDPRAKRGMTLGEVGCFLSHFHIWNEIVKQGYEKTLVLEDDLRFVPFFRTKVKYLMDELKTIPGWDLVYLGRKRLDEEDEPWVAGSGLLVYPGYSYWTLGYALTLNGAKKLLNADPLSKLLPVDEYIPILFDKHPFVSWKSHFNERNLVALSAAPLLVYPIHYLGEKGYISDTENSVIVKEADVPLRDDL